jgi:hypothetical protein
MEGRDRKLNYIVCGFLFLVLAMFSMPELYIETKEPHFEGTKVGVDSSIKNGDIFSANNLKSYIEDLNIKHPDIVYAQAKLETGHFKSSVFKKYNNLFGFRTKNGYIPDSTWKHSVRRYCRWQKKHYTKDIDYYVFLNRIGYAEDSVYTTKLKQMVRYESRKRNKS